MSNKTPNQRIWEQKLIELKRRLRRLQNENINIEAIILPEIPTAYTHKQLKKLDEIDEKITIKENELRQIKIRQKREEYNKRGRIYQNRKKYYQSIQPSQPTTNQPTNQSRTPRQPTTNQPTNQPRTPRQPTTNRIRNTPLKELPPSRDNIAFTDEYMYDRIKSLMAKAPQINALQGGIFLKGFFERLENMYGKQGMIEFINTAVQLGYKLEDYFYDSNTEEVIYAITDISEYLDEYEYGELQDFVKGINNAYEQVVDIDAETLLTISDDYI